jgi:hypothetical protein
MKFERPHTAKPTWLGVEGDCADANDPWPCCTGTDSWTCDGDGSYPSCTPTLGDGEEYWVYVTAGDADEIILYQDDGDRIQQLGTGEPPSGGSDEALECTTRSDWTSLLLAPADERTLTMDFQFTIVNYSVETAGDSATDPLRTWMFVAADGYEGLDGDDVDTSYALATSSLWMHADEQKLTTVQAGSHDFTEGECLASLHYIEEAVNDDLDMLSTFAGSFVAREAQRSAPQRSVCEFLEDGPVPASCMYYGLLTNRNATGSIELELAAITKGMDFIVVNESASAVGLSVDPNGSERIGAPLTDTNGDKVTSDDQGDSIRFTAPVDGEIRGTSNRGFYDDGA